jgi:hypothetical protein
MCYRIYIVTFLLLAFESNGQKYDHPEQNFSIDSLKTVLSHTKDAYEKLEILGAISQQYKNFGKLDSSIIFVQQALEHVQKNKFPVKYEIWQLGGLQYLTSITGNYSMSMHYANKGLQLAEQINDQTGIAFALTAIASAHAGTGNPRKALDYFFKAKKAFETYESGHWAIQNIAETYLKMNMLDSALYFNQKAYYIADTGHQQQYMKDFAVRVFAAIYAEKGEDDLALHYYRQFVSDFYSYSLNNREIDRAYLGIAKIYQKENKIDSSIFYGTKALKTAQAYNDQEHIFVASDFLYTLYTSLNNESAAFKYFKISAGAKDSIASVEKIRNIQNLSFNEQIREKEKKEAEAKQAAKFRSIIIGSSIIILLCSFLLWSRIRQLRLKYKTILEQKESEKLKAKYEKELLELEARALRAQMNPHFIFNCMNSIKALIQTDDKLRAVEYLTTFSKLIRTIFQNSDKRQVSLYDEIETCKLYTQLEAMRLNGKLKYNFHIDPDLDLKSLMVPALIIQPFIENAIWHGIVPKSEGTIGVTVKGEDDKITCELDDDGVGRERSELNKPLAPVLHESKGIKLSQARLDLEKMINDNDASIEIIDKYANDVSTGTKVILSFNLN